MTLNTNVMADLAKALAPFADPNYKHTTPSGTPSTPYYHGPGGLFGVAGLERDLIHTCVSGRGVAWVLPKFSSVTTDPLFPYITGFQDESGSEPDGVCDDAPVAGAGKSCIQTAPFGRYTRMTREMEVNRVGQKINRGEFTDIRTINDPIAPELGLSIFPSIGGSTQLGLGAEMLARFLEVGVAFVNKVGPQTYVGNPTNNSGPGGYKEFMGLDLLIGTTKVDAITGTACPSLASDVKDFNYKKVDDLTGDDIVRTLTTMYRYVKYIATKSGLNPVTWSFAMRQSLFWEITDVWACAYWSYRCATIANTGTTNNVNIDGRSQTEFRDAMRNGEYLMIDGVQIPVIVDDFINEDSSNDTNLIDVGCFASDIYLIPMSILGGRPATYFEYFDYSQGPMQSIRDGRATDDFWTDGGQYLWHKKTPLNWCLQYIAKIEPRMILKTPHIAARLTNVTYCPLQHERDVLPSDNYFVDGGVTSRSAPSLYSDWNG